MVNKLGYAIAGGGSFTGPHGVAAATLGGGSFTGPHGVAAATLGGGSFTGPQGVAAATLGGGSFTGPHGVALAEQTETRSRTTTPNFKATIVRVPMMILSPGGDNSAIEPCLVRVTQKVQGRYNKSGIREKFRHKYLFLPFKGNENRGTSGQFRHIFALKPEVPPWPRSQAAYSSRKRAKVTAGAATITGRRRHIPTGVRTSYRLEAEDRRGKDARIGALPLSAATAHCRLPD